MPEPTAHLSQHECEAMSRHLSDLADALRFLQGVSRWLAPGAQVSVEAAYREMYHKTDTALRHLAHLSQIALTVWEAQQMQSPLHRALEHTPRVALQEDTPHV